VIKGYAEFLLEADITGPQQDMMRVIVESCDRVIDLVETLIEVSRIEQGEAERALNVSRLDLREVAETSVEALRWFAARKKIQVELDFDGADFGLEADGSLLQQVVKKLLDNALKYSPPGGRVMVRARPGADDMQLEVEDSAICIPPSTPAHLEKFYMVDLPLARRVGGTGWPLPVREIVRPPRLVGGRARPARAACSVHAAALRPSQAALAFEGAGAFLVAGVRPGRGKTVGDPAPAVHA
jgi:signal transduction histidine kinase